MSVRLSSAALAEQAPEPVLVEDRHAELLGLGELGAGRSRRRRVVRLLRDRACRLAAGRPDRLLRLLTAEPGQGAGHDDGLALQRAGSGGRRRDVRQLGFDAGVGEVVEDAGGQPDRRSTRPRLAATVGPMPSTSVEPLRAPRSRRPEQRGRRPRKPVGRRRCRRAPAPASQRARSMAVDSPTCGMPRPLRMRASGRPRARWMAAYRFSALLRPNRSSAGEVLDGQPEEVAAASGSGRAARSCSSTFQPAPSMSIPPRPTKWPNSCDDAGRAGEVRAVDADGALVLDDRRPADRAGSRHRRTRARRRSGARRSAGPPRG